MFNQLAKKKILLIGPSSLSTGGIATWMQTLLKADDRKYDFLLVDSSFGSKGRPNNKFILFFKEIKRTLKIWSGVKSALRKENISVVHSSIPSSRNALWREMRNAKRARKCGSKFVLHFHCTIDEFLGGEKGMRMLRKISDYVDGFIVLNEQSAAFLKERLAKPNVVKIPNFIEKKFIIDTKKIREKIEDVLFVSRIQVKKGIYEYLKLARYYPSTTFYVVGPIIEKLTSFDVPPNVVFSGSRSRDEIFDYFDRCDLFVFLTHYQEGFPMVVLEAMARGMPMLLSNNNTLKEISEEKGGLLVDYNNMEAIKNSFEFMNKNISVRDDMMRFNIAKTRSVYEKEQIVSLLMNFYSSLLS